MVHKNGTISIRNVTSAHKGIYRYAMICNYTHAFAATVCKISVTYSKFQILCIDTQQQKLSTNEAKKIFSVM